MMAVNCKHGEVSVFVQEYKRYRVSSQRFSEKPMNVEFVVLIDTSKQSTRSPESYTNQILKAEATAIASHIETPTSDQPQMEIFNGQ
jgi:adenine-specific DNA-methyltransferase